MAAIHGDNHTSPPRRQVCLFGTSADPPTSGHVGIIEALTYLKKFDEIRVVPVYRHQYAGKRDRLQTFQQRFDMCQLSFENSKACVSDCERRCFEQKAAGLSKDELVELRIGTAELLEMLLEGDSKTEVDYSFAMGGDTFMDLISHEKWKRSRDVVRLLEGRFVVFMRLGGGDESMELLQASVQKFNDADGGKAIILNVPSLGNISSTMVRACATKEELQGLVAPKVIDYIHENKLYGLA